MNTTELTQLKQIAAPVAGWIGMGIFWIYIWNAISSASSLSNVFAIVWTAVWILLVEHIIKK